MYLLFQDKISVLNKIIVEIKRSLAELFWAKFNENHYTV